ncbi:MAG: replicative DNA helicase [Elusimicrobia bacterium RIFCSPLOWO2_02_FULL_39_32]|nr:MAG: replicative DNA helicase [Elusimicrobia bacterium GWA2_38_7]OGR80021.1 MAG: replicative DNA helicase [Elusimicrobia bacterium RIFCSPHIGHO2_02_FULL_39_36]OGR91184.1 MAG: replicative DNA helicase [Elusimicrobia bacterium RIFCSPLOWO2_02_FULL_39_32]OGS00152.1 MAG: replicative DNA helicase [Elusimicrobia bacterium RIFCSPLOWO2_12_FULL_39_28]
MVQLLDKVPPYSQEAERAVLGSMLIDREALERALELLDEKSFYEEQNQKIFSVIKTLSLNNRVVDTVTLAEELRTMNYLSSAGGAEYIAELINTVATAAHIDNYAEIVKEKAILRDLIRAATQMVGECFQENEGANSLLDKAEGLIYSIAEKKARTGLAPLSEMIHEMIENLEVLHQRKETVTGVPSGFKRFDDMTAGFQRGNLVILAARPGVGKTALALNIALHAAVKKKLPVAIFSLEMSQQEIGMRLLSSISSIPLQSLRTGFFKKSDWPIITRKAELLSEAPIYLDYSNSAMSILTLRSSARRMAAQLASKATPLSLIIIDYLQLMQGSRKNPENRQNEIAEISRSLKGLARDLNVPIIALSQLNRSPEERGREGKPQLSDLRESGALEQDADMVGFIYREAMYKKDPDEELLRKAKLIIAKQRNGPLGEIDLIFLKECARFENLEPEAD